MALFRRKPQFDRHDYVPPVADSTDLPEEVFAAELEAINARRKHYKQSAVASTPAAPAVKHGLVGVGLSGGGIRSSTFNLGLLQALDREELLPRIDYLSTVSGGGYIGSCLSAVFAGKTGTQSIREFPFKHASGTPEPKAFKHLREYASYLKPPRPLAGLRLPGLILRGLLINFLILLPWVLFGVVGTVLVAKSSIRDALDTHRAAYTIFKENHDPRAVGMPDDYRAVTIDLRSDIEWSRSGIAYDLLLAGLPAKITVKGARKLKNGRWLLPGQTLAKPVCTLEGQGVADPVRLNVVAWPGRSRTFMLTLLPVVNALDRDIVDWLLARFDAYQADVDMGRDHQGKAVARTRQLDLSPYLSPQKYILLTGMPKNAYAGTGQFLSDGRWLFSGCAAETLKLKMLIPDLHRDIDIQVSAWQTHDSQYQLLQAPKRYVELLPLPDAAGGRRYRLKTWSGCTANQTTATEQDVRLPAAVPPNRVLALSGFDWQNTGENRYLRVLNPAGDAGFENGRRLTRNQWVFVNEAIDTLQVPLPQTGRDAEPLRLIAWQSGRDAGVTDPVGLLYRETFTLTKWLLLGFILAMAFYPLVQLAMRVFEKKHWRRRDLLTRYLCGGGIALIAVCALVEIQPAAIYLFYRLKGALGVVNLFGGADKLMAVLGSLVASLGSVASAVAISKGRTWALKIGPYVLGMIGPLVLWLFYLNFCGWALHPANIPAMFASIEGAVLLVFFGAGVVLLLVSRWFYNINQTSFHPFYRDRLSRAFIFRLNPRGQIDPNDTLKLHELDTGRAPYHLLNTTLNILGKSNAGLKGRNAEFYFFSRNYVGSRITGYYRTEAYERHDPHIDLAGAMAISAAAVAPNMGRITIRSLTFLMALLNIRLGYWALNPHKLSQGRIGRRVGPWYLFKELLGLVNERSDYLNVSDGGHLENMGLYELVRRRCRYIIIGDAEADKDMNFKGLADAVRMIRIDMGIKVEIDLDDIYRKDRPRGRHFALGTIHYRDGKGYLLYVKSSVSKKHNPYIENYMVEHAAFPHETTADQFFNEAQFEAYRALGADVGEKVLQDEAGRRFIAALLNNREIMDG